MNSTRYKDRELQLHFRRFHRRFRIFQRPGAEIGNGRGWQAEKNLERWR